ncbi:MAG: SidA/IucD/PvdA family monooxygenase [Roseobacter sp.]
MLDTSSQSTKTPAMSSITCDLCVIGAGVAGLNALFVATEYLPKDAKVVLVDKNEKPGGMWTSAYDYVRLHQPHPMFTAGDLKWQWSKPPEYLASRDEVQSHMSYCLDEVRKRVDLTVLYGHEYRNMSEYEAEQGPRARITCSSVEGEVAIDTTRAIDAIGYNIRPNDPFSFSSAEVLPTTPEMLSTDGTLESDTDVFVVGGGKTAMDTILAVLRHNPDRKVTLISGKGTMFASRDLLLPTGTDRWFGGVRVLAVFGDLGMHFDGDNEDETFAYGKSKYMIGPDAEGEHFLYGLLSDQERKTITAGLSDTVREYLQDIIDTDAGPQMVFRSGETQLVPAGSTIINCTGYVLKGESHRTELMSPKGTMLAINAADSIHFLTSVSAYFLTHLWYLNLLKTAPLYRLDLETLFKTNRRVWVAASAAQAFMNTVVMIQHAPFKVSDKCGLDFDRWYPLHRRIGGLLDVKMKHATYTAHCIKVLDRVRARYNISGGINR